MARQKKTTVYLDDETEKYVSELIEGNYGELTKLIRQAIAREYKIKKGDAGYIEFDQETKDQFTYLLRNNTILSPSRTLGKLISREYVSLTDNRSQRDMISQMREIMIWMFLHSGWTEDQLESIIAHANELVRGTGREP